MMSLMLHMTEPSLQLFSSYIAKNNTYFICSLATWGKHPKVLTHSRTSPLNLVNLHTLYMVSCQDLFIIVFEYLQKAVIYANLNKTALL